MKGLLIKDLKLILIQKSFLFIILAIFIGMTILNEDASSSLGFLTFIMSFLTLSTVSYDDFDNGYAFLFTLPITRFQYVIEKYFFGGLLSFGTWLLSIVLVVGTACLKGQFVMNDFMIIAVVILLLVLILQAIMLPFQLQFGADKGRIAMICVIGGMLILGTVCMNVFEAVGIDMMNFMACIPTMSTGLILFIASILCLLILAVSMKVSFSIMKHKEF